MPGNSRSAEEHGLLLSLAMEEGRALQDQVAGVAMDMSKAYDRMPLTFLWALAERYGMPQWISGPSLRMYASMRHVRLGRVVSGSMDPLCGLLPGCPLATDWMALATWGFLSELAHIPRSMSRGWVDDLTAWARESGGGVLDLATAFDVAGERLQAFAGYKINLTKSAVLTTSKKLGMAFAAAMHRTTQWTQAPGPG